MNHTKRYLFTFIFTLMALGTIFYVSCSKKDTDPCKDVHCLNGGACNSGKCVCPTGYTGTYCETTIDPCKNVTCQNGGVCNSGTCTCPTGIGGTFCETIYRNGYTNTYKGNGVDDAGSTYSNFSMIFNITGTDLTKMTLDIKNPTSSTPVLSLTITLSHFAGTGTTFTVDPITTGAFSYTGSGIVSNTSASLTLREAGALTTTYTFASFTKQ